MPQATLYGDGFAVILGSVGLIEILHYSLVGMLALATVAVLWFAGYVVYRLYND